MFDVSYVISILTGLSIVSKNKTLIIYLGFEYHRDDYEGLYQMRYKTMLSVESRQVVRKNMSPPSTALHKKLS
jgi:hypothetical protein